MTKIAMATILAMLTMAPAGLAVAQSPGDMLDEGLNRLNRAFEELTQGEDGTRDTATPPRPSGPISLEIDPATRIWCPDEHMVALIGAFAPIGADMRESGVLMVEGDGGVRVAIQPGAGCVMITQ